MKMFGSATKKAVQAGHATVLRKQERMIGAVHTVAKKKKHKIGETNKRKLKTLHPLLVDLHEEHPRWSDFDISNDLRRIVQQIAVGASCHGAVF